jgi:hypothetical protein
MTRKKLLLLLSFVFSIAASQTFAQKANEVPAKTIENILGRWQLQKVYAGSREITSNPNSETSWIEFSEDGKYVQQGETTDRGSFRLNENHSILYLESGEKSQQSSAVETHNLSEYAISINDGVLTMQSKEESPGTKYVYVRQDQSGNAEK